MLRQNPIRSRRGYKWASLGYLWKITRHNRKMYTFFIEDNLIFYMLSYLVVLVFYNNTFATAKLGIVKQLLSLKVQ